MYKLTRQDKANSAPERWKAQYYNNFTKQWRHINNETRENIFDQLEALPVPRDPDEVDRIIGNSSWTELKCGEADCLEEPVKMVYMVEDEFNDSVALCMGCVWKLYHLMKSESEGK